MLTRPAGEIVPAASSPPSSPAPAPSSPTAHLGDIDSAGRLVGIDGILDQVGSAITRHVQPLLRETVLPVIQRDVALQREVGGAAGRQLAHELKPWVVIGAGALVVIAYAQWRKSGGR